MLEDASVRVDAPPPLLCWGDTVVSKSAQRRWCQHDKELSLDDLYRLGMKVSEPAATISVPTSCLPVGYFVSPHFGYNVQTNRPGVRRFPAPEDRRSPSRLVADVRGGKR